MSIQGPGSGARIDTTEEPPAPEASGEAEAAAAPPPAAAGPRPDALGGDVLAARLGGPPPTVNVVSNPGTELEVKAAKNDVAMALDQAKTPAEYNKTIAAAMQDPVKARALVDLVCEDDDQRRRFIKDASVANRTSIAQSAIVGPNDLSTAGQFGLLEKLTDPTTPGNPTLDSVVKSAPAELFDRLVGVLSKTDKYDGSIRTLMERASPATQALILQSVVVRATMPESAVSKLGVAERTDLLDKMLAAASPAGLSAAIAESRGAQTGVYAAVIANSPTLQEKLGKSCAPAAQQAILNKMLTLPLPRATMGKVMANVVGAMSPADKNAFVQELSESGHDLWEGFLATQAFLVGEKTIENNLLPGLAPKNLASVTRGLRGLADEAKNDPHVSDPSMLGLTVTEEAHHELKVGVEAGGEVFGVELKGSVEGTVGDSKSYEVDKSSQQEYEKNVKNFGESNALKHAADHIDTYAQNHLSGADQDVYNKNAGFHP
jgi:hypothetical protein